MKKTETVPSNTSMGVRIVLIGTVRIGILGGLTLMTSEPVGVMKCWECIEKHGRDLEHHFEDLVRSTKEPSERLKYEDWIDRIREIRREAHRNAKDISVEGNPDDFGYLRSARIMKWAKELGLDAETYLDMFERLQAELGADRAYDVVLERMQKEAGTEVQFSEPIRTERGEKTYAEIYHERHECDPESFRTIKPNPEHVLTICCPKGQYSAEAGRCLIGTMAQKIEHLHAEEHTGCSVCEAMA